MLEINSEGTVDLIFETKFLYFTYLSGKINETGITGTLFMFKIFDLGFSITLGQFNYAHFETSNHLVALNFIGKTK